MIFQTERLTIRVLEDADLDLFFDMMGNPNVMNPIPQSVMNRAESDKTFEVLKSGARGNVWAVSEKGKPDLIGLCALIKNDENDDELGYRLREQFWGQGYGTELTKGLIDYGFNVMKMDKITADVNIENVRSVKILDKFMTPVRTFFNENDNCTDRRYELLKKTL